MGKLNKEGSRKILVCQKKIIIKNEKRFYKEPVARISVNSYEKITLEAPWKEGTVRREDHKLCTQFWCYV